MAWLLAPVYGGLVLLIVLSCSILCVVASEILLIFSFLYVHVDADADVVAYGVVVGKSSETGFKSYTW
uniref:Uncharacterized protein n=1 Tax=Aegilops tauschii subsp. strangulata TaxID=200361 RepID=A0A453GKD2_AEGTS